MCTVKQKITLRDRDTYIEMIKIYSKLENISINFSVKLIELKLKL